MNSASLKRVETLISETIIRIVALLEEIVNNRIVNFELRIANY